MTSPFGWNAPNQTEAATTSRCDGAWRPERSGAVLLLGRIGNRILPFSFEGLATDNLFSPNFGQLTVFVDPRRAMVSARLNLGR